jgi:hypothetical protein
MKALTAGLTTVVALVLLIGLTKHVRAANQEPVAPSMSPADANDLIRRRCVVCHTAAMPSGGINFQLFDAASPDPGVALMISVKVTQDGAMSAAGGPRLNQSTIDEFVRMMRAFAVQRDDASRQWTIDLQVDPLTPKGDHSVVVAHKRSDAGEVQMTCNGVTRHSKIEFAPADPHTPHIATDFDGLSPMIRQIFAWCIAG